MESTKNLSNENLDGIKESVEPDEQKGSSEIDKDNLANSVEITSAVKLSKSEGEEHDKVMKFSDSAAEDNLIQAVEDNLIQAIEDNLIPAVEDNLLQREEIQESAKVVSTNNLQIQGSLLNSEENGKQSSLLKSSEIPVVPTDEDGVPVSEQSKNILSKSEYIQHASHSGEITSAKTSKEKNVNQFLNSLLSNVFSNVARKDGGDQLKSREIVSVSPKTQLSDKEKFMRDKHSANETEIELQVHDLTERGTTDQPKMDALISEEYKHMKDYVDHRKEGEEFIDPFKCVVKTSSLILLDERAKRGVKKKQLPIMTMNEVVLHNKPDDCWVIIFGVVRDLTPLIQEYKKKRKCRLIKPILAHAGKDISHWFNEKTNDVSILSIR